jgi:hypothetical protein
MVGGTAFVAGRAGAKAGSRQAEEAAAPAADAPDAPAAPAGQSSDELMGELTQLKGLLDSGTLTQAEFDAQKQKILQQM